MTDQLRRTGWVLVFVLLVNVFISLSTFWQLTEAQRQGAEWERQGAEWKRLANTALKQSHVIERQRDEAIRLAQGCVTR